MPALPGLFDLSTLVELLERRASAGPDDVAFVFEEQERTWGALRADAVRVAADLEVRGVEPGDRVVLVMANGTEFFDAFYGVLSAGAVAVPLFPRSGLERIADLAHACDAKAVLLAPDAAEEEVRQLTGSFEGTGRTVQRVPPSARANGPARSRGDLRRGVDDPHPDATALLQYTSGSTGDPKGVVLSHRNLLTNAAQMIAGMEITAEDVFVSWLPVHHDMGLILMTLVPFLIGARLVLLPSTLTDVRAWLGAIAEHRGTFTAAPDFAYRLCLRAVRDPSRFDLESLRVALNAAEPVRAGTIERFERHFGLARVMVAGYGLAEATVGVAMQPPGTAPVVDARGLVSIGRPFPGVRLYVIGEGADSDTPVADGVVGELVVESPAVTSGYFDNRQATEALLWRPGCIRTGDLAYRDAEGHVYLVGRAKNIIIQGGRNVAPQELEEAIEALPSVRRAAAVGIDRGGVEGEQAFVFAELRRAAPPPEDELAEISREITERLHQRLGLRPARVLLLRPRSIPRTANGKIRHAALRSAYLDGELRREGRVVFPGW